MYDLITIGDVTLDLFYKGDKLTESSERFNLAIGGKYRADNFYFSLGGCGANVAVAAAKFGLSSSIVSIIGENPFKGIILQKIISNQISIKELIYVRDFINISTILIAKNGDRSIIHYVSDKLDDIISMKFEAAVNKAKYLYLGNLPHLKQEAKLEILKIAKKNKITTFLTVASSDCRDLRSETFELIDYADFFALNTHEFCDLLQKKYEEMNFHHGAELLEARHNTFIVTDGNKGSYAYHKGMTFFQKEAPIKHIIDTTGAGDGYLGGFIANYFKTKDIKSAMTAGTDFAGQVISKIGAQ